MRLKRVRIFGFKTFADRTDIDLSGDLIAIVGPNGSGKSNLVDAILWGLGEGSARQLRAQSGQDVIFNGSSRRKPVGYCEVTLLFDNEDGSLPIPTPEVAVTRRLNRAGQSDYMINRQPCRLKDILDLFADSGLGRAGYAIVGQKEIDQALAASAEDRRAWVDEAAGVQRYRARKTDSLRRLAAAQEHLSRTKDILREIEAQRDPLKAEAETARRYKAVLESLQRVEIGLLSRELAQANSEIQALEGALSRALELADSEARRADHLELEAQEIGERLGELEKELEESRTRLQASMTAAERAEGAIRLCDQRLASLEELRSSLEQESETGGGRMAEAEEDAKAAQAALERETAFLANLQAELSGVDREAQALAEELRDLEAAIGQGRRANAERAKAQAALEHRRARLKELKRELDGIDRTMPELQAAVEEAKAAYEALLAEAKASEQEIQRLRGELGKVTRLIEEEEQATRKLLAEQAALEGRRRGIESTIESHEGLQQGARAVLAAVEAGRLPDAFQPVGEALEVDKRHATAIDTALGGAANDLIVPSEREAKAAIEWLKANRAGRATFQPLTLVRPVAITEDLRRLTRQPGVVGRATDLVRCDPAVRPVVDSLLGRILVVETLDDALRLARTSGWSRLVTLDGEVVHSSGAVTGGVASRSAFGMVQRKAELADTVRALEELAARIEERRKSSGALHRQVEELRDGIANLQRQIAEGQSERDDAKRWSDRVSSELHSAERERERLVREHATLSSESEDLPAAVNVAELETRRDEVVRALAARSADAEAAQRLLREAEQRIEEAGQRKQAADRRVASLTEGQAARERRLVAIGPERERILAERDQAARRREEAEQARLRAEERLREGSERREILLAKRTELLTEAKQARAGAQASADGAHQAELSRARWEGRRAAALQRLLEDYGLTEDEALRMAESVNLPDDAAALVSRLRRELRAMGDVNLGAIEAYERLTARAEELSAQVEDIEEGIRQVETGIRELDRLTQDRFAATFERLEAAFAETFAKAFGGGEGSLRLTSPGNLLETGIDIEVTLPGKKRQRLELLSGGERALCAAAFLFALLKVKPSPIVILDEIDAPLDGRNVERFIDLLQEFRSHTQFILITHNHVTILAADNWIGVTMQGRDGVSTIVPVNVAELAAAESASSAES
ncbi:MAG: chromosome segregation protein SMC [Fimbriimonadales bacterium]